MKQIPYLLLVSFFFAIGCSSPDNEAAPPSLTLLCMADLHSAHERLASILGEVNRIREENGEPPLVLINGDIFESGNVVTARSEGVVEWQFLERLSQMAPVVVNIGNHEGAVEDDLREVVRRLKELGIVVLSNITSAADGSALADATLNVSDFRIPLTLAGMATNDLNTYRQVHRDQWTFPDPVAYVDQLAEQLFLSSFSGFNIILNHGGIVSDRHLFDALPYGSLLIGGHDHLIHRQDAPGKLALHTGWWGAQIDKVVITQHPYNGWKIDHEVIPLSQAGSVDAVMTAEIADAEAIYLTESDRAIVGHSAQSFDAVGTMHEIVRIIHEAGGYDAVCINNTTFGSHLTEGPVRKVALNSLIRFDGAMQTTQVTGAQLSAIRAIANQHGLSDWANRTGEYVVGQFPNVINPDTLYTLAVNGWVALPFNQQRFLGVQNLAFSQDPTFESMRQAIIDALD
ncbi:MAG: metallophosphoesterase [Saprospiraceae bacterium]